MTAPRLPSGTKFDCTILATPDRGILSDIQRDSYINQVTNMQNSTLKTRGAFRCSVIIPSGTTTKEVHLLQ
jgi:hypothetical protein